MFKILIIPAFRLYPVDSGGAHAQLAFLEKLQHQHQIDLFVTPENIDAADISSFKERFPRLNLILSGYADKNNSSKIKDLIRKIKGKITGRDHSRNIRKYGLLNGLIQTKPAALEDIKRIANATKYDIIQAEHSVNMGIIDILPENTKKVFVHHEISHTRINSDMLSMGYSDTFSAYISGIAKHLEKNWLNLYDGVITLCREDAEILQLNGVDVPLQVAKPFALFENGLNNIYDAALPPKLLFVGSESHYPNKEGLYWFLQEVYPIICKQYTDCIVRITGTWSIEFKKHFEGDKTIQFTGFVKTLDEVYRDSILIAPVRIGSGIRIKVITAFAHGVPVVGTAVGMSGIPHIEDGVNALLADDAETFAKKTLSLLRHAENRSSLSQQGFLLAKEGYEKSDFAEERTLFYQRLLNDKQAVE